jgi:hypothetical protein
MFDSPIDHFESELYSACVTPVVASTPEVAQKWAEEPARYQQALVRFVKPMPERLRPLMEKALKQWEGIEAEALARTRQDRPGLIQVCSHLRTGLHEADPMARLAELEWTNDCMRYGRVLDGAVKNLDWVDCFALFLPAADPADAPAHLDCGRLILAIFTLDRLGYFLSEKGMDREALRADGVIRNLEARWAFLNKRA